MRVLTAVAASLLMIGAASAQTGQSDTSDRSDSGSLSAGQKESMPSTQGQGENLRGEPGSGAAADVEGSASSGASSGDTGAAGDATDDNKATMKKPMTSDPAGDVR